MYAIIVASSTIMFGATIGLLVAYLILKTVEQTHYDLEPWIYKEMDWLGIVDKVSGKKYSTILDAAEDLNLHRIEVVSDMWKDLAGLEGWLASTNTFDSENGKVYKIFFERNNSGSFLYLKPDEFEVKNGTNKL